MNEYGFVPVLHNKYLRRDIMLMISLLPSITAIFLAEVWKPRHEYYILLILVRAAGLFFARFLAKVEIMCACG